MHKSLFAIILLAMPATGFAEQTRCGWFENPTPAKWDIWRRLHPMKLKTPQGDIAVRCECSRLVPFGELRPHPKNPNRHPKDQVRLLAKLIRHHGWRVPIIVSKRSGCVVAGHARLEAAQMLQVDRVPVDVQDFATDAGELAFVVADNKGA